MTFREYFDGRRVCVQQLRQATAERKAFYVFSDPEEPEYSVGLSANRMPSVAEVERMHVISGRDGRKYLQASLKKNEQR